MAGELDPGRKYWFEAYAGFKEAIHADHDPVSEQYYKEVIALAWATRRTFLKGNMAQAVFDEITCSLLTAEEKLEGIPFNKLDPLESSRRAALVMQKAHHPLNEFLYPLPQEKSEGEINAKH